MNTPLLVLDGVSKAYPRTTRPADRIAALLGLLAGKAPPGGTCILEDINLAVRHGESMAIIGENGAGKSTLLKLITGVLAPTQGAIAHSGTRAALLELGAGFDPEYSGLENIRMNAAILGLPAESVNRQLQAIIDFADIGAAIHEPIKHYSSGMVVRLGFAIVAAIRPDLLITDEVLAVGDESFQKKCIRWMESYLAGGGTLLMVSHNMYQVQKLCRNACWIHAGRIRESGDVFAVTQAYLAWHERKDAGARGQTVSRDPAGRYAVLGLELSPGKDGIVTLEPGATMRAVMTLGAPDDRPPVAMFGVARTDGTPVYGVASDHDEFVLTRRQRGVYVAAVELPSLQLLPGGYVFKVHALDPEGLRLQDTFEHEFFVTGRSREMGLVRLRHRWYHP